MFLIQAAAKSLHRLSLQGVRFSVSSYSSLMQALPQSKAIKSLYLEDLGTLPPASITSLQELPALTKLQLRSGATTHDSHLAELANVKGLADLEITDADHLTDEGLYSLLQKDISASLTRLVLGSRRMRGHCDHVISFRARGTCALCNCQRSPEAMPVFTTAVIRSKILQTVNTQLPLPTRVLLVLYMCRRRTARGRR